MRSFLLALLILSAACATPGAPDWQRHRNARYGYELRVPPGFEAFPTGSEGERDGSTLRVARVEYAAPAPVLDVRVWPPTRRDAFPALGTNLPGMGLTVEEVDLAGKAAVLAQYRWPSGDLAFAELWLDGMVFHFSAGAATKDVRETEWWGIIRTFRRLH